MKKLHKNYTLKRTTVSANLACGCPQMSCYCDNTTPRGTSDFVDFRETYRKDQLKYWN